MKPEVTSKTPAHTFTFTKRLVDAPAIHDEMDAHTVYVMEDPPFCVAYLCPCGCGAYTSLNIGVDDAPHWKLHVDGDGLCTLSPSILRKVGCKSHYFIRNGVVVWA